MEMGWLAKELKKTQIYVGEAGEDDRVSPKTDS